MLDEDEFLSPHGIRALSRYHASTRTCSTSMGTEHRVDYEPAESTTGLFGGNSNWRGPVWFPVNYLLIESLQKFHFYPATTSRSSARPAPGQMLTLWDVAAELSRRLTRIFLRDDDGRRPVFGERAKLQTDPHWRDLRPLLRVLPRRQRRRARRQPPDRLDRPRRQAHPAERRVTGSRPDLLPGRPAADNLESPLRRSRHADARRSRPTPSPSRARRLGPPEVAASHRRPHHRRLDLSAVRMGEAAQPAQGRGFFTELGIPAPQFQAPLAATAELVCGALLLVGLFTRVATLPLIGVMAVALLTALRDQIHAASDLFGLAEYLYIAHPAVARSLRRGPALARRGLREAPGAGRARGAGERLERLGALIRRASRELSDKTRPDGSRGRVRFPPPRRSLHFSVVPDPASRPPFRGSARTGCSSASARSRHGL